MGLLKVRDPADATGQTWIAIGGTGPIGPTGPAGVDGINGTDGATGPTGPTGPAGVGGVPPGGVGGTALTKNSNTDGDVRWGGDLNTGSIFPASGEVIQFPNIADVPKINLYGTTFGIGITSGSLTMFASSTFRFRQNAVNGTEWAYIDSGSGGGRVLTEATGIRRNIGWANATLATGITGTAQYKDFGPFVMVRYSITKANGGFLSAGTMFTVPVGPAYTYITTGSNSAGQVVNWKIISNGTCQYQSGEQATGMEGVFVWPKADNTVLLADDAEALAQPEAAAIIENLLARVEMLERDRAVRWNPRREVQDDDGTAGS